MTTTAANSGTPNRCTDFFSLLGRLEQVENTCQRVESSAVENKTYVQQEVVPRIEKLERTLETQRTIIATTPSPFSSSSQIPLTTSESFEASTSTTSSPVNVNDEAVASNNNVNNLNDPLHDDIEAALQVEVDSLNDNESNSRRAQIDAMCYSLLFNNGTSRNGTDDEVKSRCVLG